MSLSPQIEIHVSYTDAPAPLICQQRLIGPSTGDASVVAAAEVHMRHLGSDLDQGTFV